MKKNRTMGRLLGTIFLLLGSGNAAWALDYSATLDLGAVRTTVSLPIFGPTPVGMDLHRYGLGNALSGSAIDITFATGNFSSTYTLLAVLFATDPNNDLFSNPATLADFIQPNINVNDFLSTHVTGYQYAAYGFAPNDTTNVSALFTPPMTFTAGTTYYAFVAGGSLIDAGTGSPVDRLVHYTLSVTAVPEPEAWAMMAVGLGLVALRLRRRAGTALA